MENESFAFQEESRSSLMDVTPAPIRPMPSQPSSSSAAVMGGGVPSGAPPKPPLPTAPTSAVAPPLFSDEESIHFFMEGGTSTGMRTPIHFSSHPPPSSASPASAPRPRAATNTTTTTTTTTSHQHNLNRTKSGALVRDMSDSLLFQLESPADGRAEASSVSPERDGRPSLLLGGGGGVGGGGSDAFTVDSLNFVVEDEGGAASRMSGTRHRHRGRRSTSHRPGGGGSTVLNDSLAFAFTDDDGSAIRRAVAPLRQAYTPSLAFEEEDLESARQEELLASAMMRRTPASPSPATGTNNTRSDEKKTVVSNHLRRASRTSSPSPRVKASTSAAAVSGATSQRAEASHTGGVVEQSSSISFQSMPTFEAHRKLDLASPDVGGSPAPRAQAEGQQPCTPERPPVAVSASAAAAAAGASSSTGKRRETEPSSPRTAPFTDVSPRRSASRKDEAIRDHLRDQETSNTVYRHPPPLQPTQQQKDVVGGGGDVPSAGVKSKTSGNSSGSPRPSTRSASRVGKSALRERSPHTAHARVSTKVFGEEATTVAVAQVETQQWKAFNAQQRAEVMQLVERIQHARDMDATLLGRTSMEEGGTAAETRRRLQRTMKKKRTTTTHDEDDDVHPRTKEAIHATITLRPTPTAALAIPPRLPTTISSAMDRGCSTMEAAEAVARLLGIQWPPHSDELHNMYFITGSRLTMEQAEHFYESVRLHQERATAMRSSTRAALSSDGGAGRISPLPAPLRPTEKSVAATSSAEAARRRSLALHPRTTTTSVKVPKRTAVLRQVFDVLDVQRCGFLRAADLPVLQHLVEEELLLMDRQSQQRAHGPEHTSLLHSAQEQHQVRFSTVDATRHGTCATTTTTTTTSSSTAAARLRRRSLQLSFAVNVLLPMAVASEIHRIDFPTLCMLIFSAVDAKSAAHSGEDQAWRDVVGQYFEALC